MLASIGILLSFAQSFVHVTFLIQKIGQLSDCHIFSMISLVLLQLDSYTGVLVANTYLWSKSFSLKFRFQPPPNPHHISIGEWYLTQYSLCVDAALLKRSCKCFILANKPGAWQTYPFIHISQPTTVTYCHLPPQHQQAISPSILNTDEYHLVGAI